MTARQIPLSAYVPFSEAVEIVARTSGRSVDSASSMLQSDYRAPRGFSMPDLSRDEACYVKASCEVYGEALKRR